MATSAIPAVIDALVTLARSVEGVTVYDGLGTLGEVGDFLMVGVDDPNTPNEAQSADSQQDWASSNPSSIDEVGQITCAALSWNGDTDQKAARDAAFATCNALATAIRSNPTLSLPTLLWARYGKSQALTQNIDSDTGATEAMVVFSVYFRARI